MSPTGRWITIAWVVLIVSGASTTGLLRAPLNNPAVVPVTYQVHRFAGTLVGVLAIVQLVRFSAQRRSTWFRVGLVIGAVAIGWLCARSLAPRIVAIHAFMAAFAALALATASSQSDSASREATPRSRPRWIPISAQLGFGLVAVQVVIGALLRHQQIGLVWHILFGGLAVLAVLAPATAVLQDPAARTDERRAARWAAAAVFVQSALGASVFVMIVVGSPSVATWLATTIAHVTVGTLTLLAAARFAFVMTFFRAV